MRLAVTLLLPCLLTLLPAGRATASCPGLRCTTLRWPAPDATEVPLNARVWIGGAESRQCVDAPPLTVILRPAGGAAELLRQSALLGDLGAVDVYTPASTLLPETQYFVHITEESTPDLADPLFLASSGAWSFTTGRSLDGEAPRPPEATVHVIHTPGDEDESEGTTVWFDVAHKALVVVAALEGQESALDASLPNGTVAEITTGDEIAVGRGPCISNWPEASPGASTSVSFGAFDGSGNFSGWTAPLEVDVPSCGCSANGGRGGAVPLLLLGLALVGLRAAGASVHANRQSSGPRVRRQVRG